MQSTTLDDEEKIIKEYEDKSEKLLVDLFQTVAHAQRKSDGKAYREVLAKLEKET